PEVREVARSNSLAVAEKAESQEICFVPDGDYAGFIDRYLESVDESGRKPCEGEIVNTRGEVLSRHGGIHRYTVGQRRGIGIAQERPLYVISIDATNNRVVVGNQEELLSSEFTAAGVNWIAFDEPGGSVRAEVRVRYRHTAAPATITPLEKSRARVVFDEPQRAITPGQATVFYRGDEVIGGGWIVKQG
ncbi:MAG: tRNA 2-thiouridine(34) synthase MnmA, partial [Acidobacteriota bacterium]|nr:tRNA 2-thiouridine(34) synthase MnmA [Acidobacteriota bacterium]